jgi:DNA polymerase III subunit alpha
MTELFGHLHRHGEFSRLDGIGTAKQYAERAAELNQPFLAQTDHGTLSGALHHIAACRKAGIVPICGVEAYYRPDRLHVAKEDVRKAWHLVLLAKNMRGWHNLLRLVSTAYADPAEGGGFYQYPCIDEELLNKYSEGLICTSACFQSWAAELIRAGDSAALRAYIRKMKNRFGADFYIEIMPHDFDDQRILNIELCRIASEEGVPVVATNDAHFVKKDWAETQRVAKMMSTNLSFEKVAKMLEKGEQPPYMAELIPNLYLCTRAEMMKWFAEHHPDLDKWQWNAAITNTNVLAQSVTPFMLDKAIKMPKVTATTNDSEKLLQQWIGEGLSRLEKEYPREHWDKWAWDTYKERIEFEWTILKDKNAVSYMIMVGDIIRWCRRKGIRVGVRGSAAGCLISYLVGISALDPISWGLLFERFLNPGRKGMPDIDIDVQSDRRQEVKEYVISKYGADHVADIITHERFQPKSVLQRLCRVFDVPYLEAKEVTDTIDIRPDDEETKLEELLPLNEKLRQFKSKYPHIWEHAVRLEGSVANVGKHAAGVIITPKPIIEYMALERGKKGDLVTSWADSADFQAVSDNGFMKVDMLGLKGLQRHDYACRLIKERHGIDIDLDKLAPARDPDAVEPEVMKHFTEGHTIGVFQFGSKGITNLLRQIKPTTAFDLCAANALYRPGPMNGGTTWDYARIKHGDKEAPKWAHDNKVVWDVLGETHGLIAYQEQVMIIAQRMGNFTPAQADDLRKAMGKLYRIQGSAAREFMQGYYNLWCRGCKENGYSDKTRDKVWDFFLGFGSYGFNKSHAGWYGFRAYQDAWLKEHYPTEFYASILAYPSGSSPQAKTDFMASVIREAKSRGIKFLPPDVNKSDMNWTVEDGGIRVGLVAIKDVGDVAAARIIMKRPGLNPFTKTEGYMSLAIMQERCGTKVNAKVIKALSESGALDQFGARDEASASQIAIWEKDRLKMVIKGVSEADKYAYLIRPNIFSQDEVNDLPKGSEVIIGGEITKIDLKKAKNGNDFANVTINFEMNEWRCRFWQTQLQMFEEYLEVGTTLMVTGNKDEWQGYVSVIVSDVCDMESMARESDLIDEGVLKPSGPSGGPEQMPRQISHITSEGTFA